MVDSALADAQFLSRVESTFDVQDLTTQRLQEWITRGNPNKISSNSRKLARELSKPSDIFIEAEKDYDITTISDLEKLRTKAVKLPVYSGDLTETIDSKLEVVKEEQRITEEITVFQTRIEEIQSLPIEEQKDLFRSGTFEERRLAGVALRRESPQVLGGLISGESRRKNRAIRGVFG